MKKWVSLLDEFNMDSECIRRSTVKWSTTSSQHEMTDKL